MLGNVATALYVFGGASPKLPLEQWLALWAASMTMSFVTYFWLRRFNLVEHERANTGLAGLALMLACIPVYVSAAAEFLAGRPLAYAVTAKGDLTSGDS